MNNNSLKFANYNVCNPFTTYNCKKYDWKSRSKAFTEFINSKNFDILLIQEGNLDVIDELKKYKNYNIIAYSNELKKEYTELTRQDYYGELLITYIKKDIQIISTCLIDLVNGPRHKRIMTEVVISFNNKNIHIYNSHYDHLSKDARIKSRIIELNTIKDKKYVISSGDKNWFKDCHNDEFYSVFKDYKCVKYTPEQIKLASVNNIIPKGTLIGHTTDDKKYYKNVIEVNEKSITDADTIDFIVSNKINYNNYIINYVAFDDNYSYVPNEKITNAIIKNKQFVSDHGCMECNFEFD